MLRLTNIAENDTSVTLKVEGEVVSDWSSLLETECLRCLATGRELVLDFSGVTLIDCRGVETLKRLQARNVKLINCPALIEDHIRSGGD